MKKNFIVHTAAEEDVEVQVQRGDKTIRAKVPGVTVELIDTDTGAAHTHVFDEDVGEATNLFVPGQEIELEYRLRPGAKRLKPGEENPGLADASRNEALPEGVRKEMDEKFTAHIKKEGGRGKASGKTLQHGE
jgi:hypothetical protein